MSWTAVGAILAVAAVAVGVAVWIAWPRAGEDAAFLAMVEQETRVLQAIYAVTEDIPSGDSTC